MSVEKASNSKRRLRKASGNVTLADVAKIAGVASITASRALRNPQQVAPETLERIKDAVARTGYVPNLLAGSLASSRSNLVVTIVPTIASPMFAPTVEALIETLSSQGYEMMVGLSGYSTSREDGLLNAILQRRPAGIVLTGSLHSDEGRRRLIASGVPVVETWDLTSTPIGMVVGFSNEKIGAEVARYFLGKGRRRLAVITGDDRRAMIRAKAFVEIASLLGIPDVPVITVRAPSVVGYGRKALAELLESHPDVEGVMCSNDLLAMGVTVEAQARGRQVPGDLSVIGFGDLVYATLIHPTLTTVKINGAEIGRVAANYIVAESSGKSVSERIVDLGFTIVERESA